MRYRSVGTVVAAAGGGLAIWLSVAAGAGPAPPAPVDFTRDVAPLFRQHCLRCHQASARKGDLSLSTPDDLFTQRLVIPGKPAQSPLLSAVRAPAANQSPRMPKEGSPLTASEVTTLQRWIAGGAAWPKAFVVRERAMADTHWWSLRPLRRVRPPLPPGLPAAWAVNPIDPFVYDGLRRKGLHPSPPADRRTLLRRVTYDLTGLPPTPAEVAAFLADRTPGAYERIVDRLLASPAYGEQWGRHWLDVIRFGESRGYERNEIITNAWPFRDYVIRSFNEDKPFDRLVMEHLAGDILAPGDPAVEVGTTFLVIGPYDDVGNQDAAQAAVIRANTLDDTIRATGEAFLGMTVGCARCHDHKFDPILSRDYYSLYATFAGVNHGSRVIAAAGQQEERTRRVVPLETERGRLEARKAELENRIAARGETQAAEYAARWTRPAPDGARIEERFPSVRAAQVRLVVEAASQNPAARAGYQIDEFEVFTAGTGSHNVALAAAGARAEGASRVAEDFAGAYGAPLTIDGKYGASWIALGPTLTITLGQPAVIDRVLFSSNRDNRQYGKPFPADYRIEVSVDGVTWTPVATSADRRPLSEAHRRRRLMDAVMSADERTELAGLDAALERVGAQIAALPPLPYWWAGTFSPANGPFPLFLGGNPQRKGVPVPIESPSFLGAVTPPYHLADDSPESQRRLSLARWIVSPSNPLTPRVLVNRLWHYHFGTGIVDTPSDFGYMGGRPTHPELLDYLADRLIGGVPSLRSQASSSNAQPRGQRVAQLETSNLRLETPWALKPLHRLIVLSQAYRQASTFRSEAAKVDGQSRYLWRFPPRRLAAEEVRDTILSLAGKLDSHMGGPGFRLYRYLQDNVATYVPLDHPGPETYRRAVYHHNARAASVDLLTDFDCPDNAFGAPRRSATTTPLQALTLMNHAFTLDMAGFLAERLQREAPGNVPDQVRRAFLLAYSRPPSSAEVSAASTLIRRHGLRAFCRALLNSDELIYLD